MTDTDTLVIDAATLTQRIRFVFAATEWRAVVVIVVAMPGTESDAEHAVAEALDAHAIDRSAVVHWVVRSDDVGRQQLGEINRSRDVLLREKRLIWFRASSAADVRFLRRTAPDLLSAIDLFVELRPNLGPEPGWSVCRGQIRALMVDRHEMLDFTGLLPGSVEQRKLPLVELYQSLVDPLAPFGADPERRFPGWLVLGHPGTGKTTYVRHLALTYAREAGDPLEIGTKTPVLVSLSDYGHAREHDRVQTLVDFLPGWLAQQGVAGATSLNSHLPDVLLLLDGLDEMPAVAAREALISEAGQLLRDNRIGGVVVTGRSFLVDELSMDHGLRVAAMREPESNQIKQFVEKFMLLRGRGLYASDLIERVEHDVDLRALARTPLMLAFMMILDELEGRLPDRRIEIYYRLAEMLVDRWTRSRSLGTAHRRVRPTRADALRILGPLAWWTVEQGGGSVPEDEMLAELERIETHRETPENAAIRARALLALLRSDTALLVPAPGRRWAFVHGTIAEYFAGIEAERDPEKWEELLDDPFQSSRREILLFCAGQLGVIEGRITRLDALVDAVLTKSRRQGWYDSRYSSLIIGLLTESPGLSDRQVAELSERLLELVHVNAYSLDSREEVQMEFSRFVNSPQSVALSGFGCSLRRWYSERANEIRWDRILLSLDFPLQRYSDLDVGLACIAILGPFVTRMARWTTLHHVDLEPTLRRWAVETDPCFRLAEWALHASPEDLNRPLGEVAKELGLSP